MKHSIVFACIIISGISQNLHAMKSTVTELAIGAMVSVPTFFGQDIYKTYQAMHHDTDPQQRYTLSNGLLPSILFTGGITSLRCLTEHELNLPQLKMGCSLFCGMYMGLTAFYNQENKRLDRLESAQEALTQSLINVTENQQQWALLQQTLNEPQSDRKTGLDTSRTI